LQATHQSTYALTTKDAHQIIVEAYKELARTWIALAASTTAQLIVDTARLMTLSTKHV
jgi:hypothetical protein